MAEQSNAFRAGIGISRIHPLPCRIVESEFVEYDSAGFGSCRIRCIQNPIGGKLIVRRGICSFLQREPVVFVSASGNIFDGQSAAAGSDNVAIERKFAGEHEIARPRFLYAQNTVAVRYVCVMVGLPRSTVYRKGFLAFAYT